VLGNIKQTQHGASKQKDKHGEDEPHKVVTDIIFDLYQVLNAQ